MSVRLTFFGAALVGLAACGEKPSSSGMCVWNQAYQQNTRVDDISSVLDKATGCYVLVDVDEPGVTNAIAQLHEQRNTVGCYTSVGTCEAWREDFDDIEPSCVDDPWDDWGDEYFVDQPDDVLMQAMEDRITVFAERGCDFVELDNMDWAEDDQLRNRYGFSASPQDAQDYADSLCLLIEQQGMQCMAKNSRLGLSWTAGATFESFAGERDWWTASDLQDVLDAGGIGVVVHYNEDDCDGVFEWYLDRYGDQLSYICEDPQRQGYVHYNTH